MKTDLYYFHQTPKELAKEIIDNIDWEDGEAVLEPFKGEASCSPFMSCYMVS